MLNTARSLPVNPVNTHAHDVRPIFSVIYEVQVIVHKRMEITHRMSAGDRDLSNLPVVLDKHRENRRAKLQKRLPRKIFCRLPRFFGGKRTVCEREFGCLKPVCLVSPTKTTSQRVSSQNPFGPLCCLCSRGTKRKLQKGLVSPFRGRLLNRMSVDHAHSS